MTQDFQTIFDGQTRAHGVYRLGEGKADPLTGKVSGKGYTVKGSAESRHWEEHFAGVTGLGMIPIKDDSTCRWGALDIDIYKELDPRPLLQAIRDLKLPLIPCRSKSGGIHVYLFLSEFAPAELVRDRLLEWAGILGHGGCEVWPKQTRIHADKNDMGNWINMPYFGTERQAMDPVGEPLDIQQFVQLVRATSISIDGLRKFTVKVDEKIEGGPPCLQTILGQGVQSGSRNKVLFALGVYAQKAYGDDWVEKLSGLNRTFFSPPLGDAEVATLVKSLSRKSYFYTCNQPPLITYCNKSVCRKCKFGIGEGDYGSPVSGTLTKVCTDPPIYFLDVEGGGRLELSAEELQSQNKFQLACMKQLNTMPPFTKPEGWRETVVGLFKKLLTIDVPKETTNQGVLREHLESFLRNVAPAENKSEIMLGRPMLEDGMYLFRHIDFINNLQRRRFQGLDANKIVDQLRRWGATSRTLDVGGQRIHVWAIALGDVAPSQIPEEFINQETPY